MIKIPQKTIYKQINQGEMFGDIWASWNLDLASNVGKVRVSPRAEIMTHSSSIATMVRPVAFIRNLSGSGSVDTYFAVCNQAIISAPLSTMTFAADTLTNSPTTTLSSLYSDGVDFNGSLIVSTLTDLAKLTSGSWTTSWWISGLSGTAFTTATPHPLCVGFTKELLIGNGNEVASITLNTSTGLTNPTINDERLILASEYEVMWIRSSNSAYWIGCRNKFGGTGKVFMWDGHSEYVNGDYKIGHKITFAGVIKDEICYTVNGNGQLLAFNGGGFTEVARFPIADDKSFTLDEELTTYPINIGKNGMAVVDNKINILLNATIQGDGSTATLLENQLSGIWEYTPETGLYHRYGISKYTTNVNDFGSPQVKYAGALLATSDRRKFLAGCALYSDAESTEVSVVNAVNYDQVKKMGYFITPKLYSDEVEDMWKKIYALYTPLKQTGDFIKIKYRTSSSLTPVSYQISQTGGCVGTWTSTTTFTSTLSYLSTVVAGNEVEILSGEGAGLSATISTITVNAGTYTITIDTAVTAASGTILFRVSNWTELETVTDLVTQNKEMALGVNANWIQFKVILYGLGSVCSCQSSSPELERLIIKSDKHL